MLEIGIQGECEKTVSLSDTALSMGSGDLLVFATPAMLALMEKTAAESVLAYLGEGQVTVGTSASISHVSATPVGQSVRCESVLTSIDGKRLSFGVKAFDKCGLIGEGTHERVVVNAEKFFKKAELKNEEAAE